MKKLTDWHPPHVKPVHVGVYQVYAASGEYYFQKWNGEFWLACCSNPIIANSAKDKSMLNGVNSLRWRGYTTKQD